MEVQITVSLEIEPQSESYRNRKAPEEAPLTRYPGAVMPFDRVSHGTPSFEDGIR